MLRRLWNQDAFQGNFLELGVHVQHLGIGGNSGKHLHKVPQIMPFGFLVHCKKLGSQSLQNRLQFGYSLFGVLRFPPSSARPS